MDQPHFTEAMVETALSFAGLSFTLEERTLMLQGLEHAAEQYARIREVPIPNDLPPALLFAPHCLVAEPQAPIAAPASTGRSTPPPPRPTDLESLAFASVTDLSHLLRSRVVSSVELTEMYLRRLEQANSQLQCVVTLTPEIALAQARTADRELAAGTYRGPLHGVPYGAKDLLATAGIPTTWGAAPYRTIVPKHNAAVIDRLADAGAVLLAKLTLGELAWGDIWFGGQTKNPWNLEEGASGSSAGSGSATSAGLVGFAIGTETYGSIVSPSTRCRVTGLRPSFGRVSRYGAMALSWTLDKIGPMARSVEDCALVFAAIHGQDPRDPTSIERPFNYHPAVPWQNLRIGYLEAEFEADSPARAQNMQSLEVLRHLGAQLEPITLPEYPIEPLTFILWAEAAAAFDELTRSDRDDMLARQEQQAWPNVFRQARLIPAVEYIQANRVRTLLIQAMAELMQRVDLYVSPTFGGSNVLLTNLTGHPAVVLPNGVATDGSPASLTVTGRLYGESVILAVAQAYQQATNFHTEHPPTSFLERIP
ncbi:MAG: amidase [Herpetosiphon sp.]